MCTDCLIKRTVVKIFVSLVQRPLFRVEIPNHRTDRTVDFNIQTESPSRQLVILTDVTSFGPFQRRVFNILVLHKRVWIEFVSFVTN